MKVVLIGPVYPFRGGIAHHTTMLARAMSRAYDTKVISFKSLYPSRLYPGASDRDPSQEAERVDADFVLSPLNPLTWLDAVTRIRQFGPDVVVIQWWTTFWAAADALIVRLLRNTGIRTIYLIHNVIPHEPRVWDKQLARNALSPASHFVVHSDRESGRLVSLLPGRTATTCPMPLFDLFAPSPVSPTEARARLGLPADGQMVLFFGLVREYKGLASLIDALGRAALRGYRFQLVVAGEIWDDTARYRALVEAANIAGRVHFHSRYIPNEDVALYFAAADLFAAPYMGGTQSAALRTALALGVPCVATDVLYGPELESLVQDGLLRIVPAGDVEALAEAITAPAGTGKPHRPVWGWTWDALAQALVATDSSEAPATGRGDPAY